MKTLPRHVVILIVASTLLALFGASCSTVRGFGRDVGKAGDHIEDSTR